MGLNDLYNSHSGRLRDVIAHKRPQAGTDSWGKPLPDEVLDSGVRCDVKVKTGSQVAELGSEMSKRVITILMRYDSQWLESDKVEWNSKDYEVQNIAPDDRLMWMVATCESVAK